MVHINASTKISNLNIYNLVDQRVFNAKPNKMNVDINLNELTSGIYIIKIKAGNIENTQKIIKK